MFILALMVEKTKFRFRKFLGNFINSKVFNIWIKKKKKYIYIYIYIYLDYKKE